MLELKNLSFGYEKEKYLFSNLNLLVQKGEIVILQGDSGSGKTTLLRIISNVIPNLVHGYIKGKVVLDGIGTSILTLPELSPKISLMMQEPENQLFFPNVEAELAFGPENLCISPAEIDERITETLELLEISHLRFQETATLSFGQKKLVALASLITLSPQVFLLDEPAAGLSFKYTVVLIKALRKLADSGKIFLIANHLPVLNELTDKFICLENHAKN